MFCTYSTCHKIISLPDSDHLVKSGDQLREEGRDGGRKESEARDIRDSGEDYMHLGGGSG